MFNWGAYAAYAGICGITPGPNNIISLTNGSRVGIREGLPYCFGVLACQMVMNTALILACSRLSAAVPQLVTVMRFVGAAYILYLAWKLLRSRGVQEGASRTGFRDAVLLQPLNPKLWLYILVSAETYIVPAFGDRSAALILFGIGMAVYSFLCNVLWLAFGSLFRRLFNEHGRVVNTGLALLLVWCAVSLFF